jgi:hypothetical protein
MLNHYKEKNWVERKVQGQNQFMHALQRKKDWCYKKSGAIVIGNRLSR